jgi:uncharacterized DUF497 family protein
LGVRFRSKEGRLSFIFEWDEKKADDNIGLSSKGRLIVVSYSERGERIRIISVREAIKKEQGEYENK